VLNSSTFILLINVFQVHVEFTDKEDRIKIEGPPEEVEKAQSKLENMATDLISKLTFVEMTVDPKFYKHIIGKSGANVNRMKDELSVVINIAENDGNNVIRIEGNKTGVDRAKQVLRCLGCSVLLYIFTVLLPTSFHCLIYGYIVLTHT
jgi:hypothetical protein